MILDTTVLIDVLRGDETIETFVESPDSVGVTSVSTVSIMELTEGIHLADSTNAERAIVGDLLEDVRAAPFDRDCAMRAGELTVQLRNLGDTIEQSDVMIAATCLANDEPVLTRNVDHFESIEGLDVRTY